MGDLVSEFRKKNDNVELFNSSIILMASYLFFMYPKEKGFKNVDYKFADTSKFNVLECKEKKEKHDSKYICRRVRNALAHSNVHIAEDGLITFEDDNRKKQITSSAQFRIRTLENSLLIFCLVLELATLRIEFNAKE
ncbi:HEPN family nuclease [Bacillus cereus]|uniref:HEPN family nuclease n=1 Tax=Bacillus cereus TaxID=1396 RepID=UPI0035CA8F19